MHAGLYGEPALSGLFLQDLIVWLPSEISPARQPVHHDKIKLHFNRSSRLDHCFVVYFVGALKEIYDSLTLDVTFPSPFIIVSPSVGLLIPRLFSEDMTPFSSIFVWFPTLVNLYLPFSHYDPLKAFFHLANPHILLPFIPLPRFLHSYLPLSVYRFSYKWFFESSTTCVTCPKFISYYWSSFRTSLSPFSSFYALTIFPFHI